MADQTPEQIEKSFQDLDYTQGIRRQVVEGISKQAIENKDPELLSRLGQALDGMDKQSLGKLKINEKAKENQTRADEAGAMSNFLLALSERRRSQGKPEMQAGAQVSRELPSEMRPDYDPQIRDASNVVETNAEFTSRMEAQKK